MRIAQVAPLFEQVPPALYGGTERVVFYLCEELTALGHDVTLFASGGSQISGRMSLHGPTALWHRHGVRVSPIAEHLMLMEDVCEKGGDFDVIHFHTDGLHLPFLDRISCATLSTMHGRLDGPDFGPMLAEYSEHNRVSISYAQRAPVPHVRWAANIYHGIPAHLYQPCPSSGDYVAFLGRLCPEKGVEAATRIAEHAGLPLVLAGKVDEVDRKYFEDKVSKWIDGRRVSFVGEIGDAEKSTFLSGAQCLLFPIECPESFGLVLAEAMACGVPVVAFNRGSVAEIVEDGVTGFIVQSESEAVQAVPRTKMLDRHIIRMHFESRFQSSAMARSYVELYQRLCRETGSHEVR